MIQPVKQFTKDTSCLIVSQDTSYREAIEQYSYHKRRYQQCMSFIITRDDISSACHSLSEEKILAVHVIHYHKRRYQQCMSFIITREDISSACHSLSQEMILAVHVIHYQKRRYQQCMSFIITREDISSACHSLSQEKILAVHVISLHVNITNVTVVYCLLRLQRFCVLLVFRQMHSKLPATNLFAIVTI